jgi:hypothetical protein
MAEAEGFIRDPIPVSVSKVDIRASSYASLAKPEEPTSRAKPEA